jgi:hypothetical protein
MACHSGIHLWSQLLRKQELEGSWLKSWDSEILSQHKSWVQWSTPVILAMKEQAGGWWSRLASLGRKHKTLPEK